ncbi:hypothetical protein J7889_04555 [Mycoplasmopsis agalactiae]|nr:hypothetical protein [Mycoplasmopsis agalactiae]MCE6056804.1 hypothetical protein [Mycoplasmopsis agalactiae]
MKMKNNNGIEIKTTDIEFVLKTQLMMSINFLQRVEINGLSVFCSKNKSATIIA